MPDSGKQNLSPNILILIVDALRAKSMSAYGYGRKTTPGLDAFAAANVRFRHAYTTSTWTIPTHASMLSGLYLSQHRVENIHRQRRFNERIVPLPAVLRRQEYHTVAFSENPLFAPEHGFDFFDEYHACNASSGSSGYGRNLGYPPRAAGRSYNKRLARYWSKMTRLRRTFNDLSAWLEAPRGDQPFFLVANLTPVHYPWAPPPDLLLRGLRFDPRLLLRPEMTMPNPWPFNAGLKQVQESHRRVWGALYDAAVAHADREISRFLRWLANRPGLDNTILLITSDHGEMLGEHRDIVGHTLTLHDNILHVPLILRHPDYRGAIQVEGVVQTLDLFPSVVEWTGAPAGNIPETQLARPSLSTAMERPGELFGHAIAEEDYSDSYDVLGGLRRLNPALKLGRHPRKQLSVHVGSHKYGWYSDRPGELVDLTTDPQETRDASHDPANRPILRRLRSIARRWRSDLAIFPPARFDDVAEMDNETTERLRVLGYID